MKYQSDIDKKKHEERFNARMALYLTSDTFEQYKIERDIQGLVKFSWLDVFVWYYYFKEKMGYVILWTLISYFMFLGIAIGFMYLLNIKMLYLFVPGLIIGFLYGIAFKLIQLIIYDLKRADVPHNERINPNLYDFSFERADIRISEEYI